MAPSLHFVLRKMLEAKQIQGETVTHFLELNSSVKRYDSAFRLLFAMLQQQGIDATKASLDEIAQCLIQLHKFSPAQARNAYSGVLLLPGFMHLRFHPLLRHTKSYGIRM